MANDEFQKERPQIQKEPSLSNARSETPLLLTDDNRFRRPDQMRNTSALISFCLGVLSLLPPLMCISLPVWGGGLPGPSRIPTGLLCLSPELALGPAAFVFGVLGLRYRNRYSTAGGLGYALFGIVAGLLISLLAWIPFIQLAANGFQIGLPLSW
jgi:hypothetical protein